MSTWISQFLHRTAYLSQCWYLISPCTDAVDIILYNEDCQGDSIHVITVEKFRICSITFQWNYCYPLGNMNYILSHFLISSTFFRTFLNSIFCRYFPLTNTKVQWVPSTTFTFSTFSFDFPKTSKFFIFSLSSLVWVNGFNIPIFPFSVRFVLYVK